MSTAHEPAYSENGLPKERYRLYHKEKAKGGLALTMTAGSAVVSSDSPEAFSHSQCEPPFGLFFMIKSVALLGQTIF
jgi:2,4-dienoyl-CoA reductase-like NADH-dependent reductase (Old Yellow Enzyme family)